MVENPDKSFLWMQDGWQRFFLPDSPDLFRLSYCIGTRWRKDTRMATNTILAGLRMLCKCGRHQHQQLRGASILHGKSWTALAEPYPRGFSKMLALGLCIKAGWCGSLALNAAGCAVPAPSPCALVKRSTQGPQGGFLIGLRYRSFPLCLPQP